MTANSIGDSARSRHPDLPASLDDRPASADERYFLEGPRSRSSELFMTLRIVRDFLRGFRVLHFVGPCVTVFGSARFGDDHPFY